VVEEKAQPGARADFDGKALEIGQRKQMAFAGFGFEH
jgi:hypothetical protein